MSIFTRDLNHHGKCREQKENFQTILVSILELYNVLGQIQLTTSKMKRDISIANLVYKLPHELPNNLRLEKKSKY